MGGASSVSAAGEDAELGGSPGVPGPSVPLWGRSWAAWLWGMHRIIIICCQSLGPRHPEKGAPSPDLRGGAVWAGSGTGAPPSAG